MNSGAESGLMKVGGTARTLDLNVSGTTPASAVAGKEKDLYKEWIEFLKQLKESNESPLLIFARTLKFYRDNVDRDVGFDLRILDKRIFAYKVSYRLGLINFFTIDGLWVRFVWLPNYDEIAVYFNHLADPEVIE